jgi:MFS family permease
MPPLCGGFLMSLYLQYIKGLSADFAGMAMMAQPIIQACISPLSGKLSDSMDARKVASAGMCCACAGLVMLCFISADTPLIFVIGILMLLGIGLALFVSPNTNAIMNSVEPKSLGVASAVCSTMRQVGQMFSMAITMIVLAAFMGKVVITPEHYPGFITSTRVAFIIFACFSFAGIFASLVRNKKHR